MCLGVAGEEEVSWVLRKTSLSHRVGTVTVSFLDIQTDRMDFLRLHLPGLHQALRGALVRGAKPRDFHSASLGTFPL